MHLIVSPKPLYRPSIYPQFAICIGASTDPTPAATISVGVTSIKRTWLCFRYRDGALCISTFGVVSSSPPTHILGTKQCVTPEFQLSQPLTQAGDVTTFKTTTRHLCLTCNFSSLPSRLTKSKKNTMQFSQSIHQINQSQNRGKKYGSTMYKTKRRKKSIQPPHPDARRASTPPAPRLLRPTSHASSAPLMEPDHHVDADAAAPRRPALLAPALASAGIRILRNTRGGHGAARRHRRRCRGRRHGHVVVAPVLLLVRAPVVPAEEEVGQALPPLLSRGYVRRSTDQSPLAQSSVHLRRQPI